MRKKKLRKELKKESPMNAIYGAFSPEQKRAFKRFAEAFGYTEEKIREELKNERRGEHVN